MRGVLLFAGLALVAAGCASEAAKPAASGAALTLKTTAPENDGASIAVSGDTVAVAWAATAENTNIYAAISRDGGLTFGAPVRVNDIDGDARAAGEQAPRIAIGTDIVVVWTSKQNGVSRVKMARSADQGRTFVAANTVHEEALPGARGWASLAIDRDGAAHVAWLDGRNANAPSAPASASTTESGSQHAMHGSMRQDVFEAVIGSDGKTSKAREALVATNVCFCCKTSVATSSDGGTYVAWRHIYPGSLRDIAVARSGDGGLSFDVPVRASEDHWELTGCPEDGPSIGVTANGVVHLAWPTLRPGTEARKSVFYAWSADRGRRFAPRVRLDVDEAGNAGAAHPQLAAGANGAAVVWDESWSGGRRIRLQFLPADGGAPSAAPMTIGDGDSYPAAALTGDVALIVWTHKTGTGSEIRVRRVKVP